VLFCLTFKNAFIPFGQTVFTDIEKQTRGTRFANFTKFPKNNPANFLLAPLSGILPLACPLT
jgi:hypothetical protein